MNSVDKSNLTGPLADGVLKPATPLPTAEPAEACAAIDLRALRAVSFRLAVSVPLEGMSLRELQGIAVGRVFVSAASAAEDVPVRCGGTLMGWAELDSMDGQMAVRLTRLS